LKKNASQVAQPCLGQAVTPPGGFVAAFEIQIDQCRAVQGFGQRGGLVAQMLAWYRQRQGRFVMDAVPLQRLDIGHCLAERGAFLGCRRGNSFSHG